MKKVVIRIEILFISLIILTSQVYATQENQLENTTIENTVKQEIIPEEKPTETKKNETMYVQERCNIRESYSVDSNRVGGLDVGTEVTVIAEYSNGWYKIKYDGREAYIKAAILRSTKPEVEEEKEDTTSEQATDMQTPVPTEMDGSNDEVDNEYAEMLNEIGVLPEVGKNIADFLFYGVIFLTISGILYQYVKYKF